MDYKTYKKHTEKFFIDKKVITGIKMQNGNMTIPKGSICKITRKFKGFSLESLPCEKCGVRIRITQVSHIDVDLLDTP